MRRRLNTAGSSSVDGGGEREMPTPSLCSDTTEQEAEERVLKTPPAEAAKRVAPGPGLKSADINGIAPASAEKSVLPRVEKEKAVGRKSAPTPVDNVLPVLAETSIRSEGDKSIRAPGEKSIRLPGDNSISAPGEKSIRAAASKIGGSQRRRPGQFVPVFAVPAPPPPTSASTPAPAPSSTPTSNKSASLGSSSANASREKLTLDTSVIARTPIRSSAISNITPSSPLPKPQFSAKKPRAPRLLTPQRRDIIVIDDDSDEDLPTSTPANASKRYTNNNDDGSESDDPLAFNTSTPAPGSRSETTSAIRPSWDSDATILRDVSFGSVFPGSDDEMESEVYVGVGTRSKTAGFMKGGGAGGRAVWAGAGTVTGADESPKKRPGSGRRR
ncbi:hypothetical protein BDV93DRAFT_109761 [Ceratobasidium sp. AG-I]|nr:hypothetical protein BDV93DRAFT_109761 [Ceratobasidium sp. AG-I]